MTMDYSLSSFQHFRHFLDFQDFGPRRCTIALSLFKIFGFLENATKRLKTTCYMTMDYSLSSFQHFRHFLDFQDFGPRRCTIALSLFKIFGFLENATKRLKTTCYMTMDYSLKVFICHTNVCRDI